MDKTGYVVGAKAVNEENEVIIITNEGIIIRLAVNSINKLGRITSGVKLINTGLDKDIRVASFAKVRESSENSEEDVLKKLEEELQEENVPVVADDDEVFEESPSSDDVFSIVSEEEDTADLDELVKRALEDRENE
jgi:DNA gyrase subunit A